MYIFFLIALSFFAVIGLATFITSLSRGLNKNNGGFAVLLFDLTEDDAEIRLRYAIRICEEIRCEKLICECSDDRAEAIIKIMQKSHSIIEIKRKQI